MKRSPALVALATLVVAVSATIALYADSKDDSTKSRTTTTTSTTRSVVERPTSGRHSDLPTITVDELPAEAVEVLALIDEAGPFPNSQDSSIFQNREGLLPERGSDHYREYTVETPGSPDRGARRIVAGADGERYYTDDHYESFREILIPQVDS